MSQGGVFDSPFCPGGRGFVHNDCHGGGGGFLRPSSRVLEVCPGGMVFDEIDSCITVQLVTNLQFNWLGKYHFLPPGGALGIRLRFIKMNCSPNPNKRH